MPYTIAVAQPVPPPLQRRPPDPGDAAVHIDGDNAIFGHELAEIPHGSQRVFADQLQDWAEAALYRYWWRRRGRHVFGSDTDMHDDYEYAEIEHKDGLFLVFFISRHPGCTIALDEHGRVIPESRPT